MSSQNDPDFTSSIDDFHEDARELTKLDDFGDPSYLDGMRELCASLDEDESLSPIGRMIFRGLMVSTLVTRLRVHAQLAQHPAVGRDEIRRPIVITGLVRTGSTALHYLMAQDPSLQKLEYWLAAQPQPRPPRETWDENPDFQASVKELEFLYNTTPDLMAVHEMNADWPEECRHILAMNFTDDRFESAATRPRYNDWYHGTTHRETYALHKKVIQLIGSNEPERRWLLKYPVHLRQLPAFFEVYPDACIVQTHRDPREVVASYASFITKIRRVHEKDVDIRAVARDQMESWAHAADAGMAARKQLPTESFFDLQFTDFMADPIAAVERIHAHFDHELSDEGRKCLEAWRAAHPQGKHGRHVYDAEATGIAEAEILGRFSAYMDTYGMQA